ALLSPTRAWVTKRRRKIFWLSFFKLERSDTSRRPSSPQFTLPLVTKKKPSVGWNGPLPSTREYCSGSRFFPNFVRSIPTRVFLIFCGELAFQTTQFWRSPRQLCQRLPIRRPRLISPSKLE